MTPLLVLRLQRMTPVAVGTAPTWLKDGERRRYDAFGTAARRSQFLAGRWLLREMLAEQLGGAPEIQPLDIDPEGRTHIDANEPLFANLSHSGNWLVAALAPTPIGVDLESLSRPRDTAALAALVHSSRQQQRLQMLSATEQLRQFHVWWTLKEAWLKRRGQGLDLGLMRSLDESAEGPGGESVVTVIEELGLVLALDGPVCRQALLPIRLAPATVPLQWRHCQLIESPSRAS